MHYPLHITLLLASLWIRRDDVSAVKNGVGSDVFKSFSKNIASVLSTTLLGDYQDPSSNQTLSSILKNIQKPQSSLDVKQNLSEGSEIPPSAYFGRYSRYTRQGAPLTAEKEAYQTAYVTNPAQYAKRYNPQAYPPYQFTVNPVAQVSYNQINSETPENVNNEANSNSIDTDVKSASLYYSNRYHQPAGFGYTPESVHQIPNSNRYPQFVPQSNYHELPAQAPGGPEQSSEGIGPIEGTDDNAQNGRITRRPYHLNYHGPFHAPYRSSFSRQPGFHPHDRPIVGEEQPVASGSGQDESNPSRIIDDQNQGQSTLGGYHYGLPFHHGLPYHGGFHYGYPGFYPGPFNHSFAPGQDGGNGTAGPFPYGRPFFEGHRFGPHVPYPPPFYPNFYGHGRPGDQPGPQENQGNAEQVGAAENGQGVNNSTGNGPPFGFPPYGPYYGGHHFPAYPLVPFNGFPHRFGYGLHDHFVPRIKTVPYLNFYPNNFHHFPLVHFYPFGGYYPYNNNNNNKPMMAEKPEEPEKAVENAEAAAPANGEVEMLSESKSEALRSQNGYHRRYSPVFIAKKSEKILDKQELN